MVLEPSANVPAIRDLIESCVPGAEQSRLFGRELSYVLPRDQINKFPGLFANIESDISKSSGGGSEGLGINSYGVSMTTLEEIFLRLGEEEEMKKEEEELQEIEKKDKKNNEASILNS
jgi:hypothetical protein